MKTLTTASLLLALASPALASSAAKWDCPNGARVVSDRGELGVSIGRPYDETAYPNRGSLNLTWNFQGSKDEVRVNGKLCKRTN